VGGVWKRCKHLAIASLEDGHALRSSSGSAEILRLRGTARWARRPTSLRMTGRKRPHFLPRKEKAPLLAEVRNGATR
jgi:hypothetical protein